MNKSIIPAAAQEPQPTEKSHKELFPIEEAIGDLEFIYRHLEGVDELLASLDQSDNWPHAIDYAVLAIQQEIEGVKGRLQAIVDREKGGAE